MTQGLFRGRSLGMSGGLAVLLTGLAATPALAGTTQGGRRPCSPPQLSQPFLSANDASWYTLAPGQTVDNFDAAGWKLSGGATLVTTQLADGQMGQVLDLPSGSEAVSPTMCVTSGFKLARTMVRDVTGAEGVLFYVSYGGSVDVPQYTGQVNENQTAWTPSHTVKVLPGKLPGWQHVKFTLIAGGQGSDAQIYNFWIDPRMTG